MKKIIVILSILFVSCSTVRVRDDGKNFVKIRKPRPVYPIKADRFLITGKGINPEVWINRRGRYFYYKDFIWPVRQRRIKLKIKK